MTLFIVMQRPKRQWRGTMSTGFVIVEAPTKAAAIRKAETEHPDYIGKNPDCISAEAQELREGIRGYI